ncbi:hypothetical protein BB561_003145 [Smittium simulii]|uniref:Endonuclease/exonuclease/phosphatase domain-containing protein n=1 Tax=Smittium simulii TaxID=133385 RepID=A0A2T9YMR1_9FUNG|nr:hypothetical protein BB561_003145 [Smittium simulii]
MKKIQKIKKKIGKFENLKNFNKITKIMLKIINSAFNPQEFTEVLIMHLLDNSTSKALKKACYFNTFCLASFSLVFDSYGGSNTTIGCSWTQFSGNINAAIDYVALKIDDEYVSYQHDSRAKATYFNFYNEESAEKCMNAPIYYNSIAAELYQTVTLEEETQIIMIPNTNSLNIIKLVEAVNNTFTKNGIIYDFSAYKNKNNSKFHTFGVKFLFKKIIYSFEIPTFLEIDKFVLALTYRESVLCLQETHLSEKTSLLQLKGYTCVESKKNLTKTGSELLIAVQNRSSWGISELRNEYSWMAAKINSKTASGKENEIIVINIHTPHLATEKKIMKKQIELYLQNIISKNENKKIILAGDFNMDTKSTINWVNKIGVGLTRMPVFNSRVSRLKKIKMGRIIDHICSVNLNF